MFQSNKNNRVRKSVGSRNKNQSKASRRVVLNWEGGLEERTLMADFSKLGVDLANQLDQLQSGKIADLLFLHELPGVGDAIQKVSKEKSLFTKTTSSLVGLNLINVVDPLQVKAVLESTFDGTTVSIDNSDGTLFAFVLHSSGNFSINTFDSGLDILNFKSSDVFVAKVDYTLNIKAGYDKVGNFVFDTSGKDEAGINLEVPVSSLPTIDSKDALLGVLHAKGTPLGSGNAIDLHFTLDLGPDKATVWGQADIQYALSLAFRSFEESKFNPQLKSNFRLNWQFSNDTNTAGLFSDFGTSPTVEFNNVRLDVGALTKDFGLKSLDNILDKAEPIFTLVRKLNEPLPGLKELSGQIDSLVGNSKTPTGINEIDSLIDALRTPSIVNMMIVGAKFSTDYKEIIENAANTTVALPPRQRVLVYDSDRIWP